MTKKTPYKGPGANSEEKHEPASDIDTAVVDSLKALDPKRPIREADIAIDGKCCTMTQLGHRLPLRGSIMRGWVHHIDLTVSDLGRSGPFYDAVLSFLGYCQGRKGAYGPALPIVGRHQGGK